MVPKISLIVAAKSSFTVVPKSFFIMVPKSFLIVVRKSASIFDPESSLLVVPNSSFIIFPKSVLIMDPKSSLIVAPKSASIKDWDSIRSGLFHSITTERKKEFRKQSIILSKFFFCFCGNRMDQSGPKYSQFRKLEYLQEKTFEIYTFF